MGYSRGTSNCPKRITLSDLTHMMSMRDPVVISKETLKKDSRCSLEKELTEMINTNP